MKRLASGAAGLACVFGLTACGGGGPASNSAVTQDNPLTAGGTTSASAPAPAPVATAPAPVVGLSNAPLPPRRAGLWRLETTNPFTRQPTYAQQCFTEAEASQWALSTQMAQQCPDYAASNVNGEVVAMASCRTPAGYPFRIEVRVRAAPGGEAYNGTMAMTAMENGRPVNGTGQISGRWISECNDEAAAVADVGEASAQGDEQSEGY